MKRTLILSLAFVGVCVLALLATLALVLSRPPTPPLLPNPNGYDDFLKAGEAVDRNTDFSEATNGDQLHTLISANAESLKLFRVGLARECCFPADRFLTNISANLQTLGSFKALVQLLVADGRLAELECRTNDAITTYLDAINFGNKISHGGWIINRLVGVACENIGQTPLARLTPALSPEQSRHVIAELEAIEAGHVSWSEVMRNEKAYMRHGFYQNPNLLQLVALWRIAPVIKGAEVKDQLIRVKLRLLIAELAVRCYAREKGHPPTRLGQVVPDYLKAVPQDPFSGQPLVYRAQTGTNWFLYSVGPDGVDNGGVRKNH